MRTRDDSPAPRIGDNREVVSIRDTNCSKVCALAIDRQLYAGDRAASEEGLGRNAVAADDYWHVPTL